LDSTFRCVACGETHEGPPRAYLIAEPAGWEVTRDAKSRRWGELFDEQAILHGPDGEEGWFIRGNVEIPVEDGGLLVFTVWVSLSRESFERAHALWMDASRVDEPPYFGWLTAELPGYPSTLNLKTNVHSRPPGQRFAIELEPTDHPLAVEQRQGVTTGRLVQLASIALHGDAP
jgi:hypothetical protein